MARLQLSGTTLWSFFSMFAGLDHEFRKTIRQNKTEKLLAWCFKYFPSGS
jgi:hypothetical protein